MSRNVVAVRWDVGGHAYKKIFRPSKLTNGRVKIRRLAMPAQIRRDVDRRPDKWVLDDNPESDKIAAAGMSLIAKMIKIGRRRLNYKTGRTRK